MARRPRRLWAYFIVLAVLTAVLVPIGFRHFTNQAEDADRKAETEQAKTTTVGALGRDLSRQVTSLCKAGGEDGKVLKSAGLCIQANVTKDAIEKVTQTPSPSQAKYIPPNPNDLKAYAIAAVADFCAVNNCIGKDGKRGPKGEPGDPATFEQVLTAVQQVIDQALLRVCGGSCDGKDGATGGTGPKGEPGSVVPGTYECGPFQYMVGLTVKADGTAEAICRNRGIGDLTE